MQGRMGRDLFNLVMNYSVTYYYPHGWQKTFVYC
jgi:hypothetical protein